MISKERKYNLSFQKTASAEAERINADTKEDKEFNDNNSNISYEKMKEDNIIWNEFVSSEKIKMVARK